LTEVPIQPRIKSEPRLNSKARINPEPKINFELWKHSEPREQFD
jgi:hypothetical protein